MQQGMVGTAMRALVAVGTLVSAFAMVACGDGGSSQSVSAIVGVTTTTVVAVQTVAFVLPHGQLFTPSLAGAVTVTFNSTPPNTFTLVGTGGPPLLARSPMAPRVAPRWGPVRLPS